jgi:2-methylcitrate dehydratase PrpD
MHQLNRKTDEAGRIVATEADYLAVRNLVAELIADAVGATIAESVRETVETVRKLAEDGKCRGGVTVHDLEEALAIERSAAQRRLTTARERGYLVNIEEKRGRPAK